jgi:hypothetical protein
MRINQEGEHYDYLAKLKIQTIKHIMESKLEKLKYPVGKFNPPEYSQNYIKERINEIAGFPAELKKEVFNLSNDQLNTPYRENGWTVRQVIHHCSDSHMNCFIRIKWVLTKPHQL